MTDRQQADAFMQTWAYKRWAGLHRWQVWRKPVHIDPDLVAEAIARHRDRCGRCVDYGAPTAMIVDHKAELFGDREFAIEKSGAFNLPVSLLLSLVQFLIWYFTREARGESTLIGAPSCDS